MQHSQPPVYICLRKESTSVHVNKKDLSFKYVCAQNIMLRAENNADILPFPFIFFELF